MAGSGHAVDEHTEQRGSGVHLYTMCSPNGWKASCILEELGVPYTVHKVNVQRGEQREPGFLAVNPVGKIPAIVDFDADPAGLRVFESGAILCHIAGDLALDTRDPQHRLLPADPCQRAEVLSWLFFQTSTPVPIAQAVAVPLVLGAPSLKDQMAKSVEELKRFMGIMDRRLGDAGGWLAAGRYTVADISHVGMVLLLKHILALDLEGGFPHLHAWLERVMTREAIKRGMHVPEPCWLLVEGPREEKMRAIRERAQHFGIQL